MFTSKNLQPEDDRKGKEKKKIKFSNESKQHKYSTDAGVKKFKTWTLYTPGSPGTIN